MKVPFGVNRCKFLAPMLPSYCKWLAEATRKKQASTYIAPYVVSVMQAKFRNISHNSSPHTNQIRLFFSNIPNTDDVYRLQETYNKALIDNLPFIKDIVPGTGGSGRYNTWVIHTKSKEEMADLGQEMQDLHGMECQLVYAINANKVPGKAFAPNKFGLGDLVLTPAQLFQMVRDKCLNGEEIFRQMQQVLLPLLYQAYKAKKGYTGKYDPMAFELSSICDADIATISNDFGEILCALDLCRIMTAKQKENIRIKFPSESNAKEVDFYFMCKDEIRNCSVKSKGKNKGTAITNDLIDMIDKYSKDFPEDADMATLREIVDIVGVGNEKGSKSMNSRNTRDRIVAGANWFRSRGGSFQSGPALDFLKGFGTSANSFLEISKKVELILNSYLKKLKASKIEVTQKNLIDYMIEHKSKLLHTIFNLRKQFMKQKNILTPYGSRKSVDDIGIQNDLIEVAKSFIPEIKNGKIGTINYGMIIYPIGKCLCRDLNSDEKLVDALNRVLNYQSETWQIETSIEKKVDKNGKAEMIYHPASHRSFSTNRFVFEYNGMSQDSGNNRPINFIMMRQ